MHTYIAKGARREGLRFLVLNAFNVIYSILPHSDTPLSYSYRMYSITIPKYAQTYCIGLTMKRPVVFRHKIQLLGTVVP